MRSEHVIDTSAAHRAANPDSARLLAAQIHQLYSQVRVGMYGGVLAAVILIVAFWGTVDRWKIVTWGSVFLSVQVIRHILVSAYHKAAPPPKEAIPWGRWFAFGSSAAAFLWGLTPVLLFPPHSPSHQFLLSLFLIGIACATAVGHSPLPQSYVPSVVFPLMPLSARYLYEGGEVNNTIGLSALLLMVVLLGTAKTVHNAARESLKLRFEKADLIEILEMEKNRVEALNLDLR